MVEKTPYIERIKQLHLIKTGAAFSDAEAAEVFEKLIALVSAVYQPIPAASHGQKPSSPRTGRDIQRAAR